MQKLKLKDLGEISRSNSETTVGVTADLVYGMVTLFKHGISIRYKFTLKNRKTNFLTNLKLR